MKRISLFVASLIVFLAACGGPPANNPLLEDARSAYEIAQNDPQIVANAPVALQRAVENLQKSEALWRDKADDELVAHYAYLARQRIHIAEEKARLHDAEQEVEQAELERKEVLLKAREQEAVAAERDAQQAQQAAQQAEIKVEKAEEKAEEKAREAEIARQVARHALEDAHALARRVAELEARETERGLILTLNDVLFDLDKASLKPGAHRAIDELAAFLNEYTERTLLIEGFTDNTGTQAYNEDLSERRAAAVKAALMAKGIDPARMQIRAYGEQYPVASNDTAAGRQQNRRVEVVLSDETGRLTERGY